MDEKAYHRQSRAHLSASFQATTSSSPRNGSLCASNLASPVASTRCYAWVHTPPAGHGAACDVSFARFFPSHAGSPVSAHDSRFGCNACSTSAVLGSANKAFPDASIRGGEAISKTTCQTETDHWKAYHCERPIFEQSSGADQAGASKDEIEAEICSKTSCA